MSYFSSLNSFKQAQTQIQQHSEDVETQNREAKAQGIEEKFEYVPIGMGTIISPACVFIVFLPSDNATGGYSIFKEVST